VASHSFAGMVFLTAKTHNSAGLNPATDFACGVL
jgi:hypothetical protein